VTVNRLSEGYVLGERYGLTRRIAVGGMGEVWEAFDSVLQRSVAVKVMRPSMADEQVFATDLVVYRVAQEAVTNIVKHANATRIDIELRGTDDRLVLTIVDDGVGVHGPEGTGTYSMRERARLVSGSFARTSPAGGGTRVVLELPRQVSDPRPAGPDRAPFPTTTLFPPPAWQLPGAADADGTPPMTDAPR
jgi:hypothetical protein